MTTAASTGLAPKVRSTLALHGALGILAGLLGGVVYLFNILGFVEIFPLVPRLDVKMPGSEAAWRGVHTGTIMNGLLAIAVAAIGPLIHLGARAQRILLVTIVITVWGNTIGYFTAAVGGERGLAVGGGLGNMVAYIGFLLAALAILIAIPIVVAGVLRGRRANAERPAAVRAASD